MDRVSKYEGVPLPVHIKETQEPARDYVHYPHPVLDVTTPNDASTQQYWLH